MMQTQQRFWTNFRAGFTLVELLVVIAIIGILTGLVSVNFSTARAKARDNQRQADLNSVAIALELYRSSNKRYPVAPASWSALGGTLASYISKWPSNPSGAEYAYYVSTAGDKYFIDIALERPTTKTINTTLTTNINNQSNYQTGVWQNGAEYRYRVSGK